MKLNKITILALLTTAILAIAGCSEKNARIKTSNCLNQYEQNSRAQLYIGGDTQCPE